MTAAELCSLLQPASVAENTHAAEVVLDAALELDLVSGPEGKRGRMRLAVPRAEIEEVAAYRQTMNRRLLGVTDVNARNFVFNLFTAWYATTGLFTIVFAAAVLIWAYLAAQAET